MMNKATSRQRETYRAFVRQHGRVTKVQASVFALHIDHNMRGPLSFLGAAVYESVVGAADFCSRCGELIFQRRDKLHVSRHKCIELQNRPKGRIEPDDFCDDCGAVAIAEHDCKEAQRAYAKAWRKSIRGTMLEKVVPQPRVAR